MLKSGGQRMHFVYLVNYTLGGVCRVTSKICICISRIHTKIHGAEQPPAEIMILRIQILESTRVSAISYRYTGYRFFAEQALISY